MKTPLLALLSVVALRFGLPFLFNGDTWWHFAGGVALILIILGYWAKEISKVLAKEKS